MVVVVIIAILASIGVPALKGLGQANRNAAADRQVLDDLSFARWRAINDRTTVYMVFAPVDLIDAFNSEPRSPAELKQLTNILGGAYSTYALVSSRTLGDQPGRPRPRYLTPWKSLPEGFLFAPYKFDPDVRFRDTTNDFLRSLPLDKVFPFPNSTNRSGWRLPYIGFNSQGQLISPKRDEVVALARGSVFSPRNPSGGLALQAPDWELKPRPNPAAVLKPETQTDTYRFVRINRMTGRAYVDKRATFIE